MDHIPVAGPWITQKEIDYVNDAVTNAWYSNHNTYHERFERAFTEYLGRRHAIALPSCTSGIHLALAALDIGPGDEVIVPDVTWIATAAPISYVGAVPVFADIDPKRWCITKSTVEAVITPRTRAIIVVDLYGSMPDMDPLLEMARQRGLHVVEDAAEAIGSTYKERKAGSFGDASVFSFHGSKTVTTGEGGMLLTDRQDIWDRALFLRDHGRPPGDTQFRNTAVAFKYKMSSMQAALGLAQIERVDELIAKKRQIFDWYKSRLGVYSALQLNDEPSDTVNSYWMVTVLIDASLRRDKAELSAELNKHGIGTRPFFHPLSSLPAYADTRTAAEARERNTTAYRLSSLGINLPSALSLNESKVDQVCSSLRAALSI